MAARKRKKRKIDPANKRLDEFFNQLNIDKEKKRQIMDYFEKLTFEQIKRLRKKP